MLTLWKSLVLPILDYCSQLWCPVKTGLIQEIEDIQRFFTRKIRCDKYGDYWERLNMLGIYSLQRRRERYRIIYTWKILENLVPNVGENKIRYRSSIRHGRVCVVPRPLKTASTEVQGLVHASFAVHGGNLFNALPKSTRNLMLTFRHSKENSMDIYRRSQMNRNPQGTLNGEELHRTAYST